MKPRVIANWKMNPEKREKALALFRSIREKAEKEKRVRTVICPSFAHLPLLAAEKRKGVFLGAQNCHWEERGAFTGEVSASQLKDLGCMYCLVGHSERREKFGESDEIIARKASALASVSLEPIVCVGETKKERKKGDAARKVRTQVRKAVSQLPRKRRIIVAYEPVWAIGGGKECSPKEAASMKEVIVSSLEGREAVVLYGGSVDEENVVSYLEAGFDGVLVGGASLSAKRFSVLIKRAGHAA